MPRTIDHADLPVDAAPSRAPTNALVTIAALTIHQTDAKLPTHGTSVTSNDPLDQSKISTARTNVSVGG